MSDQLLDDLVRAYLGEKIKRCNIMNQNGANLVYLHGKDIGKKLNLTDEELQGITPYPATTKVIINDEGKTERPDVVEEEPKEKTPLTHRVLPWVLGGALGLAAGTGVALWPDKNDTQTQPPTQQQQVVTEPRDGNVGFTIK